MNVPSDQPPFTCSRSRSTWRCSRSTVAASDAVDAEAAGAVPSWPFELTTTGWAVPPSVVPLIPAMKVAVCLPLVPIRIVPDSPALPALAMSTLLEPVVRFLPAPEPSATLVAVVFAISARCRSRVVVPVVLANSALLPATLSLPVGVGEQRVEAVATLSSPVVFERSADAGGDVDAAGACCVQRARAGGDVVVAGRCWSERV